MKNKNTEQRNRKEQPSEERQFSKKGKRKRIPMKGASASREQKEDRFKSTKSKRSRRSETEASEQRPAGRGRLARGRKRTEKKDFKTYVTESEAQDRISVIKEKFKKKKTSVEDKAKKPVYDFSKVREVEKQRRERTNTEAKADIRLNKYIANAGVCSRREADKLIAAGEIRVNGKVVTELGFKVKSSDIVKMGGQVLSREKMVYVLLNKPKDFITTTDDPENRRTVMQLVSKACEERIYPVGRLDRATTGLLLLTNDGELASKLAHPSNNIKKVYQVELDKPISDEEVDKIKATLTLEDGPAPVDEIAFLSDDGHHLGIELHIGRNRIVRRIFEHLGYEVVRLDRVYYAGLTKKDLPRGKWRFLTEKELLRLKR